MGTLVGGMPLFVMVVSGKELILLLLAEPVQCSASPTCVARGPAVGRGIEPAGRRTTLKGS